MLSLARSSENSMWHIVWQPCSITVWTSGWFHIGEERRGYCIMTNVPSIHPCSTAHQGSESHPWNSSNKRGASEAEPHVGRSAERSAWECKCPAQLVFNLPALQHKVWKFSFRWCANNAANISVNSQLASGCDVLPTVENLQTWSSWNCERKQLQSFLLPGLQSTRKR